jgi:hypothetical protein
LLFESGAALNGVVGLGGDTPLHGIVERGQRYEHFLGLASSDLRYHTRSVTPMLRLGHIEAANALLKSGASSDSPRFDGLTVMDALLNLCLDFD